MKKRLFITLSTLLVSSLMADVKMPDVFADHMVLQRHKKVNIFGKASPGETVKVTFASQRMKTKANSKGKWQVQIQPMKASAVGRKLVIKGHNTVTINDVLVGEVWHANGQSNMEWPLKRIGSYNKEVVAKADKMNIRFFHCTRKLSPKGVYKGDQLELSKNKDIYQVHGWLIGTKKSVSQFSAVAYIFAQAMYDELKVPIGILSTGAGGSPTEAFISNETLMSHPRTAALVKDWPYSKECNTPQAINNFKNVLKKGERLIFGEFAYHHPWEPSILFDTGIEPLIPYTINGAIWYQGETNQNNVDLHNLLFPMMVKDWRKQWGVGDFPVYYVQLPSVKRPTWPLFRDGQRLSLYDVDNIGMAVTIDTGDEKRTTNVHPSDKLEVGERLAYLALQNVFKKNKTLATGPLIKKALLKGGKLRLYFDNAQGLKTNDGALRHFEVASSDGKHAAVTATIEGKTVLLEGFVKNPKSVRYCWKPFPLPRPNFYNGLNHAASPFEIKIDK